jgi:DNA-binding response OmpR family regulator
MESAEHAKPAEFEKEELNHAMFESSPSPDMSGPILVIDDEPYILRSLSYLLAREGYSVETAANGEEGLQRVRSLQPPLVFLDIMMPHMNGYEVCEQIKQDPSLYGTYVIMLSAKGQQIDRERGLLGGADEYMTKPFSPREVALRVRTILAERAASNAA